jgi:hypothetical protein
MTDWSPDTYLDKQSKASMKQSAGDLSLPCQRERERDMEIKGKYN